jgi:hypothetical protein
MAVHPFRKKYFASRSGRNRFIDLIVPLSLEGRIAIVTDVESGMRWTRRAAVWIHTGERHDADGEVVWSWRPHAGAKLAMMLRITPVTVTTKPGLTGETTYKP